MATIGIAAAQRAPARAIEPVPGTPAFEAAADRTAGAASSRPHVLLDPDLATRPTGPGVGMPPGMSANEIADRIVAVLLQGTGPILLCVPGTLGGSYETSMLVTARAFVRQSGTAVSVASVPYPNGILDVVRRFFGIGTQPEQNVLALVLAKLRAAAPGRPVLLTGESLGAWLIAQTLRDEPALAATVTRIALFAKPGFVALPSSIGSARVGAALVGAPANAPPGILEFRHTDDIVPSLFHRLHPRVLGGFVEGLAELLGGGRFGYRPHHYDWHGDEAAAWLLRGERPADDPTHASDTHPTHPPRI